MSSMRLFADLPVEFVPVARPEPLLWVRRVVLAAEMSPSPALLRDPIEFRPGLNIVRVAPRPEGETRRIGNSVGKTLLTRLIRYSLGEAHFAPAATVDAIKKLRPGACVLAEVRVGGVTWTTCRPLKDAPQAASFAVRTECWKDALSPAAHREPLSIFLEAVSTAVMGQLPAWKLPKENRPPRWLDVLGWLARDQECRFQHPNEWRSPDAHSGTGRLDRDDASQLSAWVMGLLDSTEIREQVKRITWRFQKKEAEAEVAMQERFLNSMRSSLCERLKVPLHDLDDGLREQVVRNAVARTKQAIDAERDAAEQDDDVGGELHEKVVSTAAALHFAEAELTRLDGLLEATRGQLRLAEEMSRTDYLAQFAIYDGCPLDQQTCPRHPGCTNSAPDPEREARVRTLRDDLARIGETRSELSARLPRLTAAAEAARLDWQEEDRRRRRNLLDLGRADAVADDYGRYREARSRKTVSSRRAAVLKRKIEDSLKRRRAAKTDRDQRLKELSEVFDKTLKHLVGDDAGGRMTLDARGLHPAPDAAAGASGAGLGTLAEVIGFDLACLAAATAGIGHHPGFMIHDSPQNADIEDALYARVFDRVRHLEALYAPGPVGFQYIVTTTTPPPETCNGQPFVRLTFDARVDGRTLLGVRW